VPSAARLGKTDTATFYLTHASKPWVWCALQNFGDGVYLGGAWGRIHADLPATPRDPLGTRLCDLGFRPASWGISWSLSKLGRLLLGGFGPTGGGLLILGRLLDLLGDLVDGLFLRVVKARGLLELV